MVTAAAPNLPKTLISQLPEGGIIVIPIGNQNKQIMHKIVKKSNEQLEISKYNDFSFVPLIGEEGW